jgi:UPF0176 protein
MPQFKIIAFYCFARLGEAQTMQEPLKRLCQSAAVKGIVLLAAEGINGTLAGPPAGMDAVMAGIRRLTGLGDLNEKTSFAEKRPFMRLKIRLKSEIVTIGDTSVDPLVHVGTYVAPRDWDALISDPETLVIDTRNAYEVALGTFEGAVDPQTRHFGDFPAYVRDKLDPARHKKVAMFCTGGIRCEKASSLLLREGFPEVYHLKGGILSYLEQVNPDESLWSGSCFVFDERIAVWHGLVPQPVLLCQNCSAVISRDEIESPLYEPGVCCSTCSDAMNPVQRASARERQRQMRLATKAGRAHLGPEAAPVRDEVPIAAVLSTSDPLHCDPPPAGTGAGSSKNLV